MQIDGNLCLDPGDNRIRALDLGANPVRHFNKLSGPGTSPYNINAARLTVDFWRNVYTLNYEVLQLPGGGAAPLTEPSVSLWTPSDGGQTC